MGAQEVGIVALALSLFFQLYKIVLVWSSIVEQWQLHMLMLLLAVNLKNFGFASI